MAEIGDRIGAYEIVRLIARGGMATVYEARQPALDRLVALKQLDIRVDDATQLERFIRESRISASFDHPNIVHVYDFFECDGVPYIAMEYLPRGSLRPFVGHLTPVQVYGVLEGMLAALAHAEEHGVAHRDLKPENVLITRGGSVKITDFGIAKAYTRATSQFTAAGMAVGTPAYMAPEQATADQVGPYTDLYAVGVIAYELLSGGPPFEGGESPVAVMFKHVSEPPPPLTDVEPRLAAWVAQMLEKKPADRPPGAAAAWAELEEIVVDLYGPYWRRHAALGVAGTDEPEAVTPSQAEPTPPGDDDEYVTVAGDAPPRPVTPPPPEPVTEPPDPVTEPPTPVTTPPEPIVTPPEPVVTPPEPPEPVTTPPEPVTVAPEQFGDEATGPLQRPQETSAGVAAEGSEPARPSKRVRGWVIAGVGVVAAIVVAIVALSGGSPERGGAAGGPSAEAAVPFDFDGDGKPVSVVGMPRAGKVAIGGRDEPLTLRPRARFGAAVASADFDSDGRADLAVGAPRADTVTVFYGLDESRSVVLPGSGSFGSALAAGDLNGDDYPDLAVGAPEDGSVRVFFGGADELSSMRSRTLEGPGGTTRFGTVLAVGDVTGDKRPELVEAGPDHTSYCDKSCTVLDREGPVAALAVGDVTGDGTNDIVEGLPKTGAPATDETGQGAPGPAGTIRIFPGSADGPEKDPLEVTQETEGVNGNDQARDEFGAALAVADLDGDGAADMVVGAPGEDGGFGRVSIVRGGPEGHGTTEVHGYGRKTTGLPDPIVLGSRFGQAVALVDLDQDGRLDLLAAAPGNEAALTLPGTESGEFTSAGSRALALDGDADVALGTP